MATDSQWRHSGVNLESKHLTRAERGEEGEWGFFWWGGGGVERFFLFFCGVCKIRAGLHHPSHIHTHTHHSLIHTARPYLHLTSPPLPSMSLTLPPFLSLPLLGREMEQKVACNYILIFGWYLLCYRGCWYGELSHTHTHTRTHAHSHTSSTEILSRSLHIKSVVKRLCTCLNSLLDWWKSQTFSGTDGRLTSLELACAFSYIIVLLTYTSSSIIP